MQFTYRNPARSTDPARTMPGATALVVGAYDYRRTVPPPPEHEPVGRVAAYSWDDHYAVLRAALDRLAAPLREAGHRAMVLADENNLVDRAVAHRAGLGWWGKSSNLLVPGVGSLVVLGSVLTDAPLVIEPAPEVDDGCGACTKCLDECPTGAIIGPGVVDGRRCLAWLLQAEGPFPVEYRVALGDRLYGCDDCQDVCPPNMIRLRRPGRPGAAGAWVPVLELLELDDDALMARYGRWYGQRRDRRRRPDGAGVDRDVGPSDAHGPGPRGVGGAAARPRPAARRCGPRRPRSRGRTRPVGSDAVVRHLLVTNDFPPKIGGIQNYLWELWRRLPPDDVVVHTTPYEGAAAFDAEQAYTVIRSPEPWLLPQPLLARRVDRLAREHEVELVVIDPAVPAGLIGPHLSVPYATVLHGAEVTVPGRLPVTRTLLNRVLRHAVGVVAAGDYSLAEAERSLGRSLESVVVPPGVDTERFV
ncbi:MAG: DUF1730 domain-containing protein, partial [Actinobacteria bacterium]|nr:DUF1730 domain-containing protein [Actinomycetota bacterium]NIT94681.1 DUF1730 domain-containing protein [Actinomycetota bacterium]NIU18306.1 DUF1730 domain-containing protein [Actinomycetota bacterium]NIU65034.1 DUF1730 domain-containing protein [Actinomycetota bacterium]NIV54796.1 DUF1730 domain-containing protein [Actinomycetota bacterium]